MKVLKGSKLLISVLSIMLTIGFGMSVATATVEVPQTLSYQCNIASTEGTGLTQVDLTFYLYSGTEANPVTLSIFNIDDADVVNNIVSVTIDGNAPASGQSLSNASQSATLLGVSVNDGPVMQPLTKLTTSMYAVRAKYADRISENVIIDGVIFQNLDPGILDGSILKDGSVNASHIANNAITEDKLASNAFTAEHIRTNFVDKSQTTTLNTDDQGIIFAEGQSVINLEKPAPSNEGQKFTIKKIDDTIQRQCLESYNCEINNQTNFITVKCLPESGELTCIENRTSELHLNYKNSYVTLISDGKYWHIIGSNPPQDIFAPIPGNFGIIENDVDTTAGTEVTLSWTVANDCDMRRCDLCSECDNCNNIFLKYMVYYVKEGQDATTLEEIRDAGEECLNAWITGPDDQSTMSAKCNPSSKGYSGAYKVNVVVNDRYGNKAIYCSPGDNTPPKVGSQRFWTSPTEGANLINLLWDQADDSWDDKYDEFTPTAELRYAVYYIKADAGEENEAEAALQKINYNKPPENATILGPVTPTTDQTDPTKIRFEGNKVTVDFQGLPVGNYYFTIIVMDNVGNTTQYQVQSEELK